MSEMVERVARAIKSEAGWQEGVLDDDTAADAARAAIAAMRVATKAMYIAGANSIPDEPRTREVLIDYIGLAYKTMIDEALK